MNAKGSGGALNLTSQVVPKRLLLAIWLCVNHNAMFGQHLVYYYEHPFLDFGCFQV